MNNADSRPNCISMIASLTQDYIQRVLAESEKKVSSRTRKEFTVNLRHQTSSSVHTWTTNASVAVTVLISYQGENGGWYPNRLLQSLYAVCQRSLRNTRIPECGIRSIGVVLVETRIDAEKQERAGCQCCILYQEWRHAQDTEHHWREYPREAKVNKYWMSLYPGRKKNCQSQER